MNELRSALGRVDALTDLLELAARIDVGDAPGERPQRAEPTDDVIRPEHVAEIEREDLWLASRRSSIEVGRDQRFGTVSHARQ